MDLLYADFAATTPLDPRVLEAMMPYLTNVYFNAASSHAGGMQAQMAVMKARMEIASHIGALMNEIIFTSGATEAINIAILGAMRHARAEGGRNRLVTVRTEHAAVRDAAERCAAEGADVAWLPVDREGRVDLEAAREMITDRTAVVSVMAVNNETGVKQDLAAIGALARERGAWFMTDATQAYGKMPLNVEELGIDLMTFSAHKIYGPKGTGALYVRSRRDRTCVLDPLMFGGGQEHGLRSGTLNVPGIVGLATAGTLALSAINEESAHVRALRDAFESALTSIPGVSVNAAAAERSYNISNITFPIPADRLALDMPGVACSKGSACSSAKPKPSPVLTAMGRTEEEANNTLRFSFGRMTTQAEIDALIATTRPLLGA